MNNRETIKTWQWRIKRVGLNMGAFADQAGVKLALLSHYTNGRADPPSSKFDIIEGKLKELELAAGLIK